MTHASKPRRCPSCRKGGLREARAKYQGEVRHDGSTYIIAVADLIVQECDACDASFHGNGAQDQIARSLREHLGLLHPAEIAAARSELGMTQRELASQLGIAAETLSRWETGTVTQGFASDRLLRGFFGVPEFRELLASLKHDRWIGARVVSRSRWTQPRFVSMFDPRRQAPYPLAA